jgi:hypothetical protein
MLVAAEILDGLFEAGGVVLLDGDDLVVVFSGHPLGHLVDAVRTNKPQIVAFLRSRTFSFNRGTRRPDAICPCGSNQWRDVTIYGGQSIRRDCAGCGRQTGRNLACSAAISTMFCVGNLDTTRAGKRWNRSRWPVTITVNLPGCGSVADRQQSLPYPGVCRRFSCGVCEPRPQW